MSVALAALALAGAAGGWKIDRDSVERANRLHRAGAFQEAAKLYAGRLAREPGSARIRYNLGTALLGQGNAAAGEALGAVGPDAEIEVRLRALNNLGLWRIASAGTAVGQKRARAHAVAAVDAYRTALRLEPGRADASWNLAIALRMLASIETGDYQEGGDPVPEAGERERGADPDAEPADPAEEQEPEPGPSDGEGETAARAIAAAPLSQGEAARLLGTGHRDPTVIVGKLFALEGRIQRQRSFGRSDAAP
jgi:hypothetical protein